MLEDQLQVKLINITGDTVLVVAVAGATTTLDVKNLPSGTYQLHVENARFETIAAQKVMIVH